MNNLHTFLLGFVINFLTAFILVRFIYYPPTREKRYVFTFMAFNSLIYFVISLMANIRLGVGVGFGLFGVFSVLRYRTDPIPVREMTYLFVILALPMINSSGVLSDSLGYALIADCAILLILFILEKGWGFRYESKKKILYDNIALIKPEKEAELFVDLQERTGLPITRVQLGQVNLLRDTVWLQVWYQSGSNASWNTVDKPVLGADGDDD